MKILSINTGSSSIKCALFEMPQEQVLMKVSIDRIGRNDSVVCIESGQLRQNFNLAVSDYHRGVELFLKALTAKKMCVLTDTDQIEAIGHRVVHGGMKFSKAEVINDEVMTAIREYAELVPLHGFANIDAIESCRRLLPNRPNVAVFDTALYHDLPARAYLYGLPIEMYQKHGIRRYGFHGINHGYVAKEAARLIDKPLEELRLVTCHLGNGSSITAFKNGNAVDTSMGFTPIEGVLMGTRPGDLDAGVPIYILKHLGLSVNQLEELLNKESGLKGLCGKSDMRDVISLADKGNEQAINALDSFVYRIQKYIGSYAASLDGLDAIVFTAGIGENSPILRQKILAPFAYLSVRINEEKNQTNAPIFSREDSSVYAMTIPANEELAIAREAFGLV
ncbi:MAG: acetate kinase [Sedimentisphaerales bacterium]|nr:acetate kinase [Sedimentisphaerales bacterium]